MKILFCGYRPWARTAYRDLLARYHNSHIFHSATSPVEMKQFMTTYKYDVVFLAGWSWIVDDDVCNENYIVGVHPSDLPKYAGGTPLQHQIIDGLVDTQATLFRITSKLDAGGIVMQAPFSLRGNMSDVFASLSTATFELARGLLNEWQIFSGPPPETAQFGDYPVKKRLKPDDSELTAEKMKNMTARQIYDFCRCREDPYPNVFIKDHTGTLRFKLVDFDDLIEEDNVDGNT